MIIDLTDAPLSIKDGSYGGMAGFKDGIIYQGNDWLVKYPKSTTGMPGVEGLSYTTSPLSEYLGSHIYAILGFDVHETFLCFRSNKIAVACRDFCKDANLLEIRTLKNSANDELAAILERSFNSTSSSHIVDLDELLLHLRNNRNFVNVPGIEDHFWDMVVVDILINNNDRNDDNWGILRSNTGTKLSPIFDNGAAFNNKTPDSRLKDLLQNEQKFEGSVLNGSTAFGIKDKKLSAHQILRLPEPKLKQALIRNVPNISMHMSEMKKFIQEVPLEYTSSAGDLYYVCSEVRKEFYIRSLQVRLEKLLKPVYQSLVDEDKTNVF